MKIRALAPLALVLFAAPAFAEAPARVELCHIPPDDPEALHTITVSEKAAAAHVGHGDLASACDDACLSDTGACDDEDACTSDHCDGGRCSNEPLPADACDDADETTADRCEPAIGCVNECQGVPTEPCGFSEGTFTVQNPDTEECDDWLSVQFSIKLEADILSGEDVDGVLEQIVAAKPALVASLQDVFAAFTPSLTLLCEHIALEPDATLSWLGQLFSVDLVYAVRSSALPPGATESTVVSKIQSELQANPSLFDELEDELTDLAGVQISYITTNVY